MYYLDCTLPTEEENLALDEALLLAHDTSVNEGDSSWLRFWECAKPFVVLGRSSRVAEEVEIKACRQMDVSILRRVSGGATIITGPGCLMYAVVLDTESPTGKLTIDSAHQFVLGKMTQAIEKYCPSVQIAGTSDLVYEATASAKGQPANLVKFSGNSVRIVRNRILYHGTLLYDFNLSLVEKLLRTPPRQPDYRKQRSHKMFVDNINATREGLIESITEAWSATPSASLPSTIVEEVSRLVEEKYQLDSWNQGR